MDELNLEQKHRKTLDDFIGRLRETYKDDLVSVALYGSAARGEFSGRNSNINLLVILSSTSLDNLSKARKIINKGRFRRLDLQFFTEDYIKSSIDVFPIEFLDIKGSYRVLHGKDVLQGLEVDTKNLRFQCEQELKQKLIRMKNIYLRARGKHALRGLLFKSCTSLMHILKNLVRLKGKAPSPSSGDVSRDIQEVFGIDMTNFSKGLEAKQKNLKLGHREIESLFSGVVNDLEKIVNMVDKL